MSAPAGSCAKRVPTDHQLHHNHNYHNHLCPATLPGWQLSCSGAASTAAGTCSDGGSSSKPSAHAATCHPAAAPRSGTCHHHSRYPHWAIPVGTGSTGACTGACRTAGAEGAAAPTTDGTSAAASQQQRVRCPGAPRPSRCQAGLQPGSGRQPAAGLRSIPLSPASDPDSTSAEASRTAHGCHAAAECRRCRHLRLRRCLTAASAAPGT